MKKNKLISGIYCLLLYAIILTACKKDKATPVASSSLTIVNAIAGGSTIVTNFNSNSKLLYYKTAQQIAVNGFGEFPGYTGDIPLAISLLSDTAHTICNQIIHIEKGGTYSLFLTGTPTAAVAVFIQDDIHPITDSAVNIRFVNLSTDSAPVSINVTGNQSTSVINSLPYKSVTPYQLFTVKKATPATGSYSFDIRDATTARLITTYTLTGLLPAASAGKLFKNFTIIFKGLPGGTGTSAQSAILVNNY